MKFEVNRSALTVAGFAGSVVVQSLTQPGFGVVPNTSGRQGLVEVEYSVVTVSPGGAAC